MSAELIDAANKLLGETVPGVTDILRIGVSLAKTAEKIPGMKGSEKMDAVLVCLREILAGPIKEKLSAEELRILQTTVDTVIPVTITLMIDASRAGEFIKKNIPMGVFCTPCRVTIAKKAVAAVEAPVAPVAPAAPVAPVEVPEAPEAPATVKAPEAPATVKAPEAPEAPATVKAPEVPEAPATVKAPEVPLSETREPEQPEVAV